MAINTTHEGDDEPPPDGGYGWVCVAACFMINCFTWGIVASYGVYLSYYLRYNSFPGASSLDFAFVGGSNFGAAMLVAPLVTFLGRKFGTRTPMFGGVFALAGGFIAASFASKAWHLYLCQGVLVGIGVGFIYIPSIAILSQWFSRKRSLANGITSAGSGIGGVLFSLVTGSMIENISLAWSLRITGIIAFTMNFIAVMLVRDRNKVIQPAQHPFDTELLSRQDVWLLLLWAFISMLGYITLLYSLPDFALSIGLSRAQATDAITFLNLGTAVGRPLIGALCDYYGRIKVPATFTLACGISCFAIWVPANSFGPTVLFALTSGSIFVSEAIALKLRRSGFGREYLHPQIFTGVAYIVASAFLFELQRRYQKQRSLPGADARSRPKSKRKDSRTTQDHAPMGDEKSRRFDDALSSLVESLVPAIEDEDEAAADERHDDALDLARNIINEGAAGSLVEDVQHAADLIKKQLLRENGSPEKAVQFSNLYSRLLSQPVLSKKWEILYLLHQLSGSTSEGSPVDATNGDKGGTGRQTNSQKSAYPGGDPDLDDQTYKDAFATSGLPKLPTDGARGEQSVAHRSSPERNAQTRRGRAMQSQDRNDEPTTKISTTAPTEATLLRELPFTLQGLSTTNMPFTSQASIELPASLPLPIVSIMYTLAEPSLLYRSLNAFVESRDEGLIGQSLRSAIQNELRSYLGLISSLETQIRQAVSSFARSEGQGSAGKVGVTLKRCVVWTREATMGLRLMSVMVEKSKTKKGGQLISMVHFFSTSHGDPFVGGFAERMLSHVTRPFYDMLRQWIYDGELLDPYHEFFVIEQGSNEFIEDPRRAPATSVWEEKYKLDESMIPSIVTEDFARKVFLIGKSLNFIRYSCGDSAWVEAYSKDASRELTYGDTATLETSIDQAYRTTMARLIHLMDNKFQLFAHLSALKRYLLLGQGDFIALLMESLSINLDRPAGSQYRHTLTAQLEHAIRGSNAQYDPPDILRRLDARLTEMEKGDTGWDVFTLEYKVDAPVDVVITPWANRQYLKIFNLLWRVKRVEFSLSSTWRRCMTGARGVLASPSSPSQGQDWKAARCAIAEMIHFVNQLQYYILFEVIEASWSALHNAISKPDATLDDLIFAHTKYLKAVTHKGLLGSVRTSSSGHKEDVFTVQLHEILKIMLAYKDAVDGLYSYSVAEFTRKQEVAAKIETRTAQGKWGITSQDVDDDLASPAHAPKGAAAAMVAAGRDPASPFPVSLSGAGDEASLLPNIRARLQSLSGDFKGRINVLLGDLAAQPDVDMKFLAVVMNFNDVYQPKKKRRHVVGGAEKKTPGGEAKEREGTVGGSGGGGKAEERRGSAASTAGRGAIGGKGKGK